MNYNIPVFNHIHGKGRDILERIARRVMVERGFQPDFSIEAINQLAKIQEVHEGTGLTTNDLRNLLWVSIDNDESLDLDQLTVAEAMPDNAVRIRVAVADVAILVKRDTPIDEHARQNTTSIYTAGKTFSMLPERLSTGLTSLNLKEDRPAIVIDMVIDDSGEFQNPDIYLATVHNYAKLTYRSVGAWLDGTEPVPDAITAVPTLADNILMQDRVAQKLRIKRHEHGALNLETLEARPVFAGDVIKELQVEVKNRATRSEEHT
jgi:VacB/RNase II family 3'-5' exoribonuclease